MTSCGRLSDRMVAVAHGLEVWTAEEREHLAACAECGAEWRLVQRGQSLGGALPQPDLDKIVAGVGSRLAMESDGVVSIDRGRRGRWWLGGLVAAALILVAVQYSSRPPEVPSAEAVSFIPELEDLTATELEVVLDELDGADPSDDGRLGDLDVNELEQVLEAWES